jgi:hypothetical protein
VTWPLGVSGNQAFWAAFFLSVHVRDRLQNKDKLAGDNATSLADFIRNAHVIMARMIIESDDTALMSSRLRYFSMLSMLSLHRVVFDLVEGDSLPLHGSASTVVQLATDILIGCGVLVRRVGL